jgi:hypothetical protein
MGVLYKSKPEFADSTHAARHQAKQQTAVDPPKKTIFSQILGFFRKAA